MRKLVAILSLIVLGMVGLHAKEESPWKEIQSVVLPQSVEIHEGTTRNGNPKAWIEIDGVNVSVSPTSAKKFKAGEIQLELVKWFNNDTKKYRYSTRIVKQSTESKGDKNIDLKGLFK